MPRPPRSILEAHGLFAKKSWGQNFLVDPTLPERIAQAGGLGTEDVVVEIGAGLGHLTAALARSARHVVAVERDREIAAVLREEVGELSNVEVVEANAVTFDLGAVAERFGRRLVVAGNLPYHLSSQILVHLLDARAHVARAILMLQKEVAVRIAAPPRSREYGVLSVMSQLHADLRIALEVPRGAFHPRPKVQSAILRLDFLGAPRHEVPDEALFRAVVHAAFGQRRKTVRNALLGARTFAVEVVDAALAAAGIDPRARAETLSVADYAALTRAVAVSAASCSTDPSGRDRPRDR